MSVSGELYIHIVQIIDWLLEIYKWIIIIAAIISWVSPDPYNPIVRFLRSATEPVFSRGRKLIGYRFGPIDITPVIVIIVIVLIQQILAKSIIR
jgi:YggT family protein